ncbi:uncharacterized protein LOC119548436 [Drosophila subpulchrella]|uniref:uncharacterized protein LOC119548436 n=1 Tax=Drosophila subpulchrella TaxID=1486046 RepID=UPI0018A154A5|nr:uncharacterized protein LOC119548436 [Drosophila subpulchrella]
MSGLTRRRRTAQQILLRRALNKSVSRDHATTELVRNQGDGVETPFLIRDLQQTSRIRERSSSRAVRKLHRILAANPFRHLGERNTAGKLSGCALKKKDSCSWRKLKPSEDKPTLSSHSLKTNEHSRGSTRSRHSSSTYPSTWHLNLSRAKEEPKENSNGSLEEIMNCSILNRTPYDHQLNTPLKSDNSCQCAINKKARRRSRKTKVVPGETKRRYPSEDRNVQLSGLFQRLKERVYSGEEFRQVQRICKDSSKISRNSKISFDCKKNCPGRSYKNYGGYSPSETDIEMPVEYQPKIQSRSDYLNKIERISKPPSGLGNNWSLKLPSKTEIQQYMDNPVVDQPKYKPQDRKVRRKISHCYCTKGKRNVNEETVPKRRGLNKYNFSNESILGNQKSSDKIPSQASLLSSEKFSQRFNDIEGEDNLSQSDFGKPNAYQQNEIPYGKNTSNVYQSNKYDSKRHRYSDRDEYSSNNSDNPKTRISAKYNQTDKASFNARKHQSSEYRNAGDQRATRSLSSKDPSLASLKMANAEKARRAKNSGPKCVEAITQTSELVITYRNSSEMPNNAEQPKKIQKNVVRSNLETSNQENVKQVQSGKTPKSQQDKAPLSKPTGLRGVQSNSLILESHEDQYGVVQSSKEELESPQESYQSHANSVRSDIGTPNQENIKQVKSVKATPKSQQPRQMKRKPSKLSIQSNKMQSKPQKSKPTGLSLVPSRSFINLSEEKQPGLAKSSSIELIAPEVTAPKTKKVIHPRKRKRSRCRSCCSQCSTRKRSLKKPNPSDKTKSPMCENCQCKIPSTKSKEGISKLSTSKGNCDVRELLDILHKTVAGLEKQMNNTKGFKTSKNSKSKSKLNDIQNKPFIDVRAQHFPYPQDKYNSERNRFDEGMPTFRNQQYSSTTPTNAERTRDVYQNDDYSNRRFGFDGGNSSNIFRTNSYTGFTGPKSSSYGASPNSVEISAISYQNNPIQRPAMPENDSFNKGLGPANVRDSAAPPSLNNEASLNYSQPSANNYHNNTFERQPFPQNDRFDNGSNALNDEVPYRNEEPYRKNEYDYPKEISERKSQPYRNQEPFKEPIGITNETQGQTMGYYNNQSFNQPLIRACLCTRNDPQMEVYEQSPLARKPMTDSAYSQGSKGTTSSGRTNPKEICRGPEFCPYRSMYNADDGQRNRGPVTFQDVHPDIPNTESRVQKPLQICDNSICPYASQNSKSWNSPSLPISNQTQPYPTEIDLPKCNPECVYEQSINSGSCKGPEYCPYRNNRGAVTFEDSSRSRNYQDPSTGQEAMQYSTLRENPIYPMSNRTQSYPRENDLTKGEIECYCDQKERHIPFQKGGTANNSEDFCGIPYCPENNTINNVSTRTERRQAYPDFPEQEPLYRSSNKYQNKNAYQQELRECPGRQLLLEHPNEQICPSRAVENVNYAENQTYFNDPRHQKLKESYRTEECLLTCPTRLKCSYPDDTRRGGPRFTVVSSNRREEKDIRTKNNKQSYLAANDLEPCLSPKCPNRLNRVSNKENFCNNRQCPDKRIKSNKKAKQVYQDDNPNDLCENPNCPDKNPTNRERYTINNSINDNKKWKGERQTQLEENTEDVDSQDSCPEDCPNRGYFTNLNNQNKKPTDDWKTCGNPKCPDRSKRLSKKENWRKDSKTPERKRCTTQRYEKAYDNSEGPIKNRTNRDQNKYPSNNDHYNSLSSKRKNDQQLCENPKCPDKNNIHKKRKENGYAAHDSQRSTGQKQKPRSICSDPDCPGREDKDNDTQYEKDPDINRTNGYDRQRYRFNNDINNGKTDNGFGFCDNPKCPDRLREVDNRKNYEDNHYENKLCENPHCPDKLNTSSKREKYSTDRERDSNDKCYCTDELDLCSMDCPERYRVLFTDLRRCKNKQNKTSRQSSGRADIYDDDHIKTKSCNACKRYVPLERDRQAINKYCNPCRSEAAKKTESVESFVRAICISPGKQAPIFVRNRHNPLVTDPIFNSYDKHILKNFEKYKEENKLRKCIEDCPFIGRKNISQKSSSDCSCEIEPQEYSSPCDCQREEIVEHEDTKKNKSKVSFFGCCTILPKDESKSEPEPQRKIEPAQKEKTGSKPIEKTESKLSGFSCFKRKEKPPQEKTKPKEKTASKTSGFSCFKRKEKAPQEKPKPKEKTQSKSSGFTYIKQKETVPQEEPKPKEKAPASTKSSGFLCFKKTEKRPKEDKRGNEKVKDSSEKQSKRSGFFSWYRKSDTPKEYRLKKEEVPSTPDCTCKSESPPKDEEVPMLQPSVPFRCPCAPDEIGDGEVKVLYDSSFRFQKESCSCAEVPKTIYCHNNPQNPGQETSDWYASSRASSTISCRQNIEEQEIPYCPCASANGFYKIVR